MKILISRKKNIAFTLVLYYHSSSTSAESDHESATGASASANTRGQRRFVFSAKKSSQRGDFQQHPCKEFFFFASQMKCWLHDCCIFYFIVQQKIKHSHISSYYFAIQYLRGSSYFKDIPNPCLLFTFCFLNIKIFTA